MTDHDYSALLHIDVCGLHLRREDTRREIVQDLYSWVFSPYMYSSQNRLCHSLSFDQVGFRCVHICAKQPLESQRSLRSRMDVSVNTSPSVIHVDEGGDIHKLHISRMTGTSGDSQHETQTSFFISILCFLYVMRSGLP